MRHSIGLLAIDADLLAGLGGVWLKEPERLARTLQGVPGWMVSSLADGLAGVWNGRLAPMDVGS